jgi:hypothetical protein
MNRARHLGPRRTILTLCVGLSFLAASAEAQTPVVIPRLTGVVQLDGWSDEPAWEAIDPLPVVMQQPSFGGEPTERTEMRIAHDGESIYVMGRLYMADPKQIRAPSLKRDQTGLNNDWFAIILDTFSDRENAVGFVTNPNGIRSDLAVLNDAAGVQAVNFNWNTFWDVAVQRSEEGWFVEMRIPLSSLRFQERDGQVEMGLIAWRYVAAKSEVIVYPAIPPNWGYSMFKPSQAQTVVLEGVRSRKPLYVTPYALGGGTRSVGLEEARSAYRSTIQSARDLGVDLKYGISSNLTLDLTYNTDFAQVEADDQQINLTRFSLFFPEKRPFFQERSSVFEHSTGGRDRLFHSRRIGLAAGRPVPIHAGVRMVGRLGGWDVGVINMQTAAVEAIPTENHGVVRLRRQVVNPHSYLGAIVTSRVDAAGDYNAVYGLDGVVRLAGDDYLSLNWAQTFGSGLVADVLDAALLRAEWERRTVKGLNYRLEAARVGGVFDPVLGYMQRTDYTRLGDRIAYGWLPGKTSPLSRHMLAWNSTVHLRNRDHSVESATLGPQWSLTTKRNARAELGITASYDNPMESFRLAREVEVPAGSYAFHEVRASYETPSGSFLRGGVSGTAGSYYDGWRLSIGATPTTWNVSSHLELSGTYQFNRVRFRERDQGLDAHVARLRALAMFSTRLSAAGFVQYNSAAQAVGANLRARYNPAEGNDLYLVYNHGLNTDRDRLTPALPLTSEHTLLVKYSRTFTFDPRR